jgi:outer membrane protein assembly factor BamD
MLLSRKTIVVLMVTALAIPSLSSCFRKKKYENPISKDTQQPDKVLFDKAVKDIERGRYEVARITLNTLMNTYDTSEYLAKAKLAIADSWMREGGSNGMAQAEAEYKDFILFYPTMEEAAEAQQKVCMIHYKQMEKPDRDDRHAFKSEEECRTLLTQFPNSKFAPQTQQLLRNIQEVLAEKEFRVGTFYNTKGSNPAASNRLQNVADQWPLYSKADMDLWLLADSYSKMGPRFKVKAGQSYQRLVRDYPLSPLAKQAADKLKEMEMQVPESDPVAIARMKYEEENRIKAGMMHNFWGVFKKSPDTLAAAKSGSPAMEALRPTLPASIPLPLGVATGVNDVGGQVLTGESALEKKDDARLSSQQPGGSGSAAPAAAPATETPASAEQAPAPLPNNRQVAPPKKQKKEKKTKVKN